jgi:hypothetical protein
MSATRDSARPVVTVAMPTRNGETWLAEAIESVLAQSLTDFELLVVDNASTDSTPQLVARYAGDPRVIHLLNERNIGFAGSVNRACREARGEAILVIGSDDRLHPGFLEAGMAFLRAHPDVSMVHGPAYWIDDDGRRFGGTGQAWPPVTPGPSAMVQAFEAGFCFTTMLMRTEAIRGSGPFDEAWQEVVDLWLFMRLCQMGKIGYLDAVLCDYRVHADAMSMPMYSTNLMFRRQMAAARECFAWPQAIAAGVAGDRRRAERAAARTALRVLHMSRPEGIGRTLANFGEVLRHVPQAAFWPRSWAFLALALLPFGLTSALRRTLRRRAMARMLPVAAAPPAA